MTALGEALSLAMEKAMLRGTEAAHPGGGAKPAGPGFTIVNQKLFSLSLSAHAAKDLPSGELLRETLEDIHHLSHDALKEMRSLIWQLRPAGLEEGVVTALRKYGRNKD